MDNYQPNSHRYRETKSAERDKKPVQKVITGTAKVRQKSEARKLADKFVSDDAHNLKSYVVDDFVIPMIKKLIVNSIRITAETIFGESSNIARDYRDSKVPYVSYDRFSGGGRDVRRDDPRSRSKFDYNNIGFERRGDAEMVLDLMDNMLREYGQVSISDMYEAAGLPAPPYTSGKYGWTNLSDARIVRQGDEYVITMSRPRPL